MEFKYGISILFSNIGYVFKIMVYMVVVLLIVAAIGAAILYPLSLAIVEQTDIEGHIDIIKDSVGNVWDGSHNIRYAATIVIPELIECIKAFSHSPGLFVAVIAVILLLYALYSFLMGICMYTVADIVNKLMTSNLRFGFASGLVLNLKKSVKYSSAKLLAALPIDIVVAVLLLGCVLGLFKLVGVFVLPIILVLGAGVLSLRALLFSGWLPRYLYHDYERPLSCLSRSFPAVKLNLADMFKSYAVVFSLVYVLFALLAIPTGGLVIILLPCICHFLLRTIELIGYFKTKGFNFYVDGSTVINTVDYGFRRDNQLVEKVTKEDGDE